MDLNLAIAHLKTAVPEFGNRVAGAAEHEQARTNGYLAVPAIYLIPLAEEAEANIDSGGLTQIITETIGVVLVLDNTIDRRGQAASSLLDSYKYAVHRGMLGWRGPDAQQYRTARGLQYEGGSLVSIDGARLVYQLSYSQQVWISDADGWQPPGDPLLHIDGHDARKPTLDQWSFDTPLDQ